jgi:dTDP-glucose 4,6-dehydratase
MRLLVAGGAGFIGSHFIRHCLQVFPDWTVVNFDKLTYAGNPENLADLEGDPRYSFVRGDICDADRVKETLRGCQALVNFAAETHVDRSILGPDSFLRTDVFGMFVLLEACTELGVERFVQISTDEVYGPIEEGCFSETSALAPRNPYSASKAAGDLLALSYWHTHGFPVLVTRGCNTYGPNQYPEKLIPLFVTNALEDKPLPLYGDGQQMREWIYVTDHVEAIALVLVKGKPGEVYNIGTGERLTNLDITRRLLRELRKGEDLIAYVDDRPGHDHRYALESEKIRSLGWAPRHSFDQGLKIAANWYLQNRGWWEKIKSGEFRAYYERQYRQRLEASGRPWDSQAPA